jgi:hypothetical protein
MDQVENSTIASAPNISMSAPKTARAAAWAYLFASDLIGILPRSHAQGKPAGCTRRDRAATQAEESASTAR